MVKRIGVIVFGIIAAHVHAQDITVQGKAVDAMTNKGIKSKISYKSYPTGGITGNFNDSTFTFPIFGSSKYSVTAEAEHYISRTILVDPKEAVDQKILRDISLVPAGHTVRLSHLIFETGKSEIDPKSFPELDELVAMMRINTHMEIQLEGHTDAVGNMKANMDLSQDRVDAVKKYMTSKGISKDRIKTKAFGGTQPLSKDKTEEARALNRRVEMRVLKD